LGQAPGVEQGLAAFGGVFNDVDDVADIHHIGGHLGLVGAKVGVPAAAGEAQALQVVNVGTVAATVVEVGGARAEKTRFDRQAQGF
jgi:hypothetical protein